MKTQAATRLSVTESSFTQDEINEFRRIRESLWAKEMKSAMAQKNDERMEKLMKMDIGRTLDGLTKALSKIKVRIKSFFENTHLFAIFINQKMRKNNLNLALNKNTKFVRYVEDSSIESLKKY